MLLVDDNSKRASFERKKNKFLRESEGFYGNRETREDLRETGNNFGTAGKKKRKKLKSNVTEKIEKMFQICGRT